MMTKTRKTRQKTSNQHEVKSDAVDVELDIPTLKTGFYEKRRVELLLDPKQRKSLRMIFDGLQYSGAKLANGKDVRTQQDAVRWMLEEVASNLVAGEKGDSAEKK